MNGFERIPDGEWLSGYRWVDPTDPARFVEVARAYANVWDVYLHDRDGIRLLADPQPFPGAMSMALNHAKEAQA